MLLKGNSVLLLTSGSTQIIFAVLLFVKSGPIFFLILLDIKAIHTQKLRKTISST